MAKNHTKLVTRVQEEFPGANPSTLPSHPAHDILIIPTPPFPEISPSHPPYLGLRIGHVVSHEVMARLMQVWDQLLCPDVGLKIPPPDNKRSGTGALHLGVWSTCQPRPCITWDSKRQTIRVVELIDNLLGILKQELVPPLKLILQHYSPDALARGLRWLPIFLTSLSSCSLPLPELTATSVTVLVGNWTLDLPWILVVSSSQWR